MSARVLENRSAENARHDRDLHGCTLAERAARGHPVEAQVLFLADGGVMCREPGRQHGFADYAGALGWVERNTYRAHPAICAFVIELW